MVQSRCHTSFFPHGGFRLSDDTIPQTVLFPDLFTKPLIATFDQPHASSDGGGILLKAAERRYGLVDGFARCLVDDRAPSCSHGHSALCRVSCRHVGSDAP